jgi:hypothetical protein
VARKRRKKKFTQLKRKINIFIRELKWAFTVFTVLMVKVMSLNSVKLVLHVGQALSWPNIGIDIIVDSVTLQSRWTLKQLRKTNRSWRKRKPPFKLRKKLRRKKLPIRLQLEKERKMQRKEKRNDCLKLFTLLIIVDFVLIFD